MEIQGETFQVHYDPSTTTITFKGSMRPRGQEEYAPIVELINTVADAAPEVITLDLQALNFLNSSGINMLFVYIIKVRDQGRSKLWVRGSQQFPWQGKSLSNLQRLMPELQLELV